MPRGSRDMGNSPSESELVLTAIQYPRFHLHASPPLRRFLLPQKHRRSSPSRAPLVERSERHIR